MKPFAKETADGRPAFSRHIGVPFDPRYAAARTWVQRILLEPRVPKPEGYRFMTDADAEMHYMLKAILLRPVYLSPSSEEPETKEMLLLRAYRALCTSADADRRWSSVNMGADAPGPFERGWHEFWSMTRPLVGKPNAKVCPTPVQAKLGQPQRYGMRRCRI